MVVASIALFVAVGGISWAAATIGTDDIQNKAVTAKKLDEHSVGKKKIKSHAVHRGKISGDQRTLWAAVKLTGAIPEQSGGIEAERTGTGHYTVVFGKKVSGRAIVVSAARDREIVGASPCTGGTGVGADCSPNFPNDRKHVLVHTMTPSQLGPVYTNLPFYIAALPK
jgi:hypothetical protein